MILFALFNSILTKLRQWRWYYCSIDGGGTVLVDGSGMNGGSNPEAEILPGSFRTFGEASDANVFFKHILLFLVFAMIYLRESRSRCNSCT